jgi:chemotaxis protein methyltransferase CheR/type IV pilus assembly protein PilK
MECSWSGLDSLPELDDEQYAQWKNLLEARTGMMLPNERRSFLATSLGLRMREIGFNDYQSYYEFIASGAPGEIEWATLVDRLTVHETRFFRHVSSIQLLRDNFMPRWIETNEAPYSLQIWSVGCSTGEEPYTLAMVMDDYLDRLNKEYYLGVTASDISMASLATGRKAIYHRRKLTEMEPGLFDKYLQKIDSQRYQVVDSLRKRVCFAHLNVLDMKRAPIGKMDIIFCQNMLIYFDRDARIEIIKSLIKHLREGGILILGAGEILGWTPDSMERITFNETLAFRRLS